MKNIVPLIAGLIILGALMAGCTGTQNVGTPAPTPVLTLSPAPTPAPSFTLGESYLSRPTPYSFTSEKDPPYTEEFRATNEPWGIEFTVNPTNEDPQYTWFEMKVMQMDTGKTETFGYGRTFGLEKHQLHPMYNSGPYKIEMRGNRVSVKVNVAKRNP